MTHIALHPRARRAIELLAAGIPRTQIADHLMLSESAVSRDLDRASRIILSHWGTKTLAAYAAWQRVGGPYDGIPGFQKTAQR
jgi:DNA-binding transcriptional ArsR family regulator